MIHKIRYDPERVITHGFKIIVHRMCRQLVVIITWQVTDNTSMFLEEVTS